MANKQKIKCFLLEEIDQVEVWLRRYASGTHCPTSKSGYHNQEIFVGVEQQEPKTYTRQENSDPEEDSKYPQQCDCGYVFSDEDQYQIRRKRVYRRQDTGEELTLDKAPAGAMWIAWWWDDHLLVKLPDGHHWDVDGKASNCTRPEDNEHQCWPREGDPPEVTVSKNGNTCSAGAGSIGTDNYHGFLRDGFLVEA